MKKLLSILAFISFFIFLPFSVGAAVLYLDPETAVYGPKDSFSVTMKLDVDSGCVNTIESTISFPANVMSLMDFTTGESIISIWVDKPSQEDIIEINRNGEIYFAGGIPGGYCGRIPGDPGESNIIGRLIFSISGLIVGEEVMEYLDVTISPDSKVYLNDGFGTEDNVKIRNSRIRFAPTSVDPGVKWLDYLNSDDILPEPFVVELHQNPTVFNGAYYIIFNTTDKQTGIDHYEVLEIKPGEEVGVAPELNFWERLLGKEAYTPQWLRAEMPYLLQDQTLKSIIKVKAVDKADNERLVEYIPPVDLQTEAPSEINLNLVYLIGGTLLIFLIIIVIIIIFIYKRRSKQPALIQDEESQDNESDSL